MVLENVTLPIILGTALVDSINPCAIGVLLFLVSVLLRMSNNKGKMLLLGTVYISAVYIVYLLSGLGLIWFQYFLISKGFAEIVGIIVGVAVVILGCIELRDFFSNGEKHTLKIPEKYRQKIVKMTENIGFAGSIVLGGFVAMVELPCTGGPYLAITALLAKGFNVKAFTYLLIYNFIFVLPLIIIVLAVYFGASTLELKKWRTANIKWMNFAMGLIMIALGLMLILSYRFGWFF